MKNFIFKSHEDFHKILFNKLETIQSEQKHARIDLAYIIRCLNKLSTESVDQQLQKQVDQYFEDDDDISSNRTENK